MPQVTSGIAFYRRLFMNYASFTKTLIAVAFLGAATITAAQAQVDGGGGNAASSPSASPTGNSNFNNGSAYARIAPCGPGANPCPVVPRQYPCGGPVHPCPPVVQKPKVVVELPAAKCQLERIVQTGTNAAGEAVFVRRRDCDRVRIP